MYSSIRTDRHRIDRRGSLAEEAQGGVSSLPRSRGPLPEWRGSFFGFRSEAPGAEGEKRARGLSGGAPWHFDDAVIRKERL
jgi:hypothetical protein